MVGYDVYEDKRDFSSEEKVKRYVTANVVYPCYIVSGKVEIFKFKVLGSMQSNSTKLVEGLQTIEIYYKEGDKMAKVGRITPAQVKSFLKLFECADVIGFYDKDTKLEGDYLYTLSS